jgi:hypothetical protein
MGELIPPHDVFSMALWAVLHTTTSLICPCNPWDTFRGYVFGLEKHRDKEVIMREISNWKRKQATI